MGDWTIIPYRDIFALAYSIVGLAFVVLIQFVFRHSWRFLDILQFCFIFATIGETSISTFSKYLSDSWIKFIPNFLTFCQGSDYLCTTGYALGFLICLIAFLIILSLVTIIERFRRPSFRFQTIYNAFKGLFKWVYLPICYYSFYFLIKSIRSIVKNEGIDQIIPSAVVTAFFVIGFPFGQLLMLAIFSRDDVYKWNKLIELVNYLRIQAVCLLAAFSIIYDTKIPFYIMYLPFIGYDIFYLILQQFHFKIYGRVTYVAGQTLFYVIFSLFLFKADSINEYDLDFFVLGLIMIIDLCFYFVRFVHLMTTQLQKTVVPDDADLNPQQGMELSNSQIQMPPSNKKQWQFQSGSGQLPMDSRDSTNNLKATDRYVKAQRRRR